MSEGGLKGINEVMANINKELMKIKGRTQEGLVEAAIQIQVDMVVTPPTVPVDTGNLRASKFITTPQGILNQTPIFKARKGMKPTTAMKLVTEMAANHSATTQLTHTLIASKTDPVVVLGFTANYAVFVHENVTAKFKGTGTGAKFFEQALVRNEKRVIDIVQKYAKIR